MKNILIHLQVGLDDLQAFPNVSQCLPHTMRQQKKTRVALIEYYLFNAKYGGWYKVQIQQLADWLLGP